MSNATEMHLSAQLLAREFARGDVTLRDNEELEFEIRLVRAYCQAFLDQAPTTLEERHRLAAHVYAKAHEEMYGG